MQRLKLTADRFPSLQSNQYIDRHGQYHDLPSGAVTKTRVGIFGITLNAAGKLLVTSPPHALDVPGLPGGGREGIETHAQTLQREYFEEIGAYFVIKETLRPIFQQRILYFAEDADEYWRYDQYFYMAYVHHLMMPSSGWITPEGGRAQWIPLCDYHCITAAHKPAVEYYLQRMPSGTNHRWR